MSQAQKRRFTKFAEQKWIKFTKSKRISNEDCWDSWLIFYGFFSVFASTYPGIQSILLFIGKVAK